MRKSTISWEIVLAGLAFIGIGIYLLGQNSTSSSGNSASVNWKSEANAPTHPVKPSLPGAIVIDLQNLQEIQHLEQLEKLKQLKNFENLKELEVKLKNLDKIIEKNTERVQVQESLDKSLQQLEAELQKIEKADFQVKLQNQKIYINKNYDVEQASWTEVSPGVFVYRDSFTTSDLESMDLQIEFGNLNIVGSEAPRGEITLRATGSLDDPATISRQLNIQKDFTNPQAVFKTVTSNGSDISDQINLEATLTLPREIKLSASTSGGHINASNMSQRQQFKTSGGHITLEAISGETSAKTAGGHITGNNISGNTSLSTSGGHIKVDNASGSLSAKTGGGHIKIQQIIGSITAKTSGGNISTSVQEANGPLNLTTSAGNITLSIPESIAATLDVSGSSVHLADVFDFSGTKNQGKISGDINGGGLPVVINCGYGNVNINANN